MESVQQKLFGEDTDISFDAAAHELGVSVASIRNWVKTGYIEKTSSKAVSRSSWETFVKDVAGTDKLTKRANKVHRDDHDHESLREAVISRLRTGDPDECSTFYESRLSNAHRNKEGVYYTSTEIAGDFFDVLPTNKSSLHFCDPCCGSGNFLLAALNAGFPPENIHGFDVDPIALEIASCRLTKHTNGSTRAFDLRNEDFLLELESRQYDVVFTNPPWGKKLPKASRDCLAQRFGTGRSNDTCSLFVSAAIRSLRTDGLLGMLLPDSFFNVASFEDVREFLSQYRLLRFVDHGKPFEGLVTKAKSFILEKTPARKEDVVTCISPTKVKHTRRFDSFLGVPKRRFNFLATQDEAELIASVFSKPHITLDQNARWGLGIVTGNNKKHVQGVRSDGMRPVWKGADLGKNSMRPPTNYISEDFTKFQQVAKPDLYHAPKKLIYKFISSDLVFFLDDQQRLILNSANLVIPDDDFPVAGELLAQFFNSEIMSWLFKSLFETHKVLRSDLEALPIFHEFLDTEKVFDENELLKYLNIERVNGSYRIKE